MYMLTLTKEERAAFDWVGGRYSSDDVAKILMGFLPEGREWCDEGDITFMLPEHAVWEIDELAFEEGYLWPCFAPELAAKMNRLVLKELV